MIVKTLRRRLCSAISLGLCWAVCSLSLLTDTSGEDMPKHVQTIEGIAEYRLDNGLQVLLFPDQSKPLVTVNMTVFVGSRHEGYGEAGMAHLLEHMLFKGTETNPEIPKALQDRGARYNGTTWVDRTNYYETLNASQENLEFALALEADRLLNSRVRGEDLNTEMTVVRSEFERGENSPHRVLQQRLFSAAYDWHNYGKSTIGNRSDIERVPIDALRRFYKKYYRPDNVMLVVAGKFNPDEALDLIQKYFGPLTNPDIAVDRTYTVEPPQDGERVTVVRRVGEIQLAGVAYHVPAASHPDFAAIDVAATSLADEPSGRLYKALITTKKAASVYGGAMAMYDPGLAFFMAELPKEKSLDEVTETLIKTLEKDIAANPFTEEEFERARRKLLKDRELRAAKVQDLAIELSEWAAQGDWRLYFLYRDRLESVKLADAQRAAEYYFAPFNRTLAKFIPTEQSRRLDIPESPNVQELLAGYEGREAMNAGEEFDPSPENIDARTQKQTIGDNFEVAVLPKSNRGQAVRLTMAIRFGTEDSLFGHKAACEMLGPLMMRGCEGYTYQQLLDRFDELLAEVRISSQPQLLTVSVETKAENLAEVLKTLKAVLRSPTLDEEEFELLRNETLVSLESNLTEPQALAPTAVARAFNTKPFGHIHYTPTIEEEIDLYRKLTIDEIRQVYAQLGGANGQAAVVGEFDADQTISRLNDIVSDWDGSVRYVRVDKPANTDVAGETITIETPDKANAIYYASQQYAMSDSHPDYPALTIGNYILGAGALSSRLGDRVRQKDGLSYGVGSGLSSHPIDERTSLTIYAINNPQNREKVTTAIREEIERLLADGITEEELERAKTGFLQSNAVSRANDASLVGVLLSNLFAKRDMSYFLRLEEAVAELDKKTVDETLRRYIDLDELVVAVAGDFSGNAPDEEGQPAEQTPAPAGR